MKILVIDQLTFEASHYIKGHPKCSQLHGHTYIVRDLRVHCSAFVDFSNIKAAVEKLDHHLLIPEEDIVFWGNVSKLAVDCGLDFKILWISFKGPTTVENISEKLASLLLSIPGVEYVSFTLLEGLKQGTTHRAVKV